MYGQTLLHKAVSDDNMKLVEYLLDLGANPNIKDYVRVLLTVNLS